MEKLYHIKKFNDPSEDLIVGQTLEFSKDKLNDFRYYQKDYSGCYCSKTEEIDGKIINHYEDISSLLKYDDLKRKSESEIKKILDIIESFHYSVCLEKREMILEEVRREKYSDKPSRYNCMWLTDEECISSWILLLDAKEGNYSINEMELDGNIFVSTDELLPNTIHKTVDMYNEAHEYWNPTKEQLESSIKREYLFEGYAKVKRKVK